MPEYGPELVIDGTFINPGANWTYALPWEPHQLPPIFYSMKWATGGATGTLSQSLNLIENWKYSVSFTGTVESTFSGSFSIGVYLGNTLLQTYTHITWDGSHTITGYAGSTKLLEFRASGICAIANTVFLQNVSVKEILAMPLTRAQIKSRVQTITGKSNKDSLIEDLCDSSLKEAMLRHKFEDAKDLSDVVGTINDTTVALPSDCKNIISIAVIDSDNHAAPLILKPEHWYNTHIGVPEQYNTGWPKYGARFGSNVYLDRPIDAAYTFRIRHSKYPVFIDDTTECPIEVLDTWLVEYISALIFQTVEDNTNYVIWMRKAVGTNFDIWNGGTFAAAMQADEGDNAIELDMKDTKKRMTNKPTLFTDDGTAWFSH